MDQDLHDRLDSLTAVLPRLDAVMDGATDLVRAVDRFLVEELPVGPWLASRPFDSQRTVGEDGRELRLTTHLACGRVDDVYRLHVLRATLDRPEGQESFSQVVAEERTVWHACPPEIRLQAFVLLPELLGLLAGKINEITTQTARAIETVRAMLGSINNREGRASDPAPLPHGADVPSPSTVEETSARGELFKRPRLKIPGV